MRRQFEPRPRQGEAAEDIFVWHDRRRRRLVLGLPGKRIGEWGHQRADARGCRGLLAPVNRREQHATLLPLADGDPKRALSVVGDDAREIAIGHTGACRVVGMNFDERLRQMLAQPRADAAAGHGVPLIPDAAGVEPQRPCGSGLGSQRGNFRRDEACLVVVCKKSTVGEKALLRLDIAEAYWPQHRCQVIERLIR